jgi:hypothetical protein
MRIPALWLLLLSLACSPAQAQVQVPAPERAAAGDPAVQPASLAAGPAPSPATTTNRIALLIGNAKYTQFPVNSELSSFPVLKNSCNDIDRIAGILEREGWLAREIIKLCDAPVYDLYKAILQFKDAYLERDGSLGFVFYAGHGIQVGGETFFFGTDASLNLGRASQLAEIHPGANIFKGGVRLFGTLLSEVGNAGTGSIFIAVDACRETPIDTLLAAKGQKAPTNHQQAPLGVRLLYSAGYGKRASDGLGAGSPFALAFEEHLKSEGRIDVLIGHVTRTVSRKTINGPLHQHPDAAGALNPPPPEGCLTKCGGKP